MPHRVQRLHHKKCCCGHDQQAGHNQQGNTMLMTQHGDARLRKPHRSVWAYQLTMHAGAAFAMTRRPCADSELHQPRKQGLGTKRQIDSGTSYHLQGVGCAEQLLTDNRYMHSPTRGVKAHLRATLCQHTPLLEARRCRCHISCAVPSSRKRLCLKSNKHHVVLARRQAVPATI